MDFEYLLYVLFSYQVVKCQYDKRIALASQWSKAEIPLRKILIRKCANATCMGIFLDSSIYLTLDVKCIKSFPSTDLVSSLFWFPPPIVLITYRFYVSLKTLLHMTNTYRGLYRHFVSFYFPLVLIGSK